VCLVAAPTALGKGASEATITGAGLDGPIHLAGEGQAGGERLMRLADDAGFFAAGFARSPDPMLDSRPRGKLRPKYEIEYVMPGGDSTPDHIVQDLYPYATPQPVSYMKPGQSFWTTEKTRGGWYVSSRILKRELVAVGLPTTAPADGSGPSGQPW